MEALDSLPCPVVSTTTKLMYTSAKIVDIRARRYLGQMLIVLAILGHLERFSPGQNGPEVGGPEGLWLTTGPPTLERILLGENLSE